jgi:hypothetical protein
MPYLTDEEIEKFTSWLPKTEENSLDKEGNPSEFFLAALRKMTMEGLTDLSDLFGKLARFDYRIRSIINRNQPSVVGILGDGEGYLQFVVFCLFKAGATRADRWKMSELCKLQQEYNKGNAAPVPHLMVALNAALEHLEKEESLAPISAEEEKVQHAIFKPNLDGYHLYNLVSPSSTALVVKHFLAQQNFLPMRQIALENCMFPLWFLVGI